ncbi:FAD/NAD(P)-binding protein [Massilia sp. CCM 9210]|uniref:FAD/NAD(P)-binding protein n=1 Tax=Massilia scottii TaxID=3057166 RepID=UPI0027964C58|nr:FAD/NAD(P)-binding domain-containing protein [Massilia sp. CCM 9210]MDQ1814672.1 FAD/NAD(P)-binding protein [Massilia sp. CCM 9210]
MKPYSVTLIGMGPRGLSILERIAAFARAHNTPLQVNLIEPGECGPGVHSPNQPQHLLINTVASQVTIFPFREAVELAPVCATPSLTEWARDQGYRRFGEQFVQVAPGEEGGAAITESDYLPRQLLGRYLIWAYDTIRAALPPSVTLTHLRQRAIDMFQMPDGSFMVELDSGFSVSSDFVFMTTGHSRNNLTDEEAWCHKFAQDHARYNGKLAFIRHVYPLDKLVGIASDARVAIEGLGLTAHDVVSQLTVGRGGRFEPAGSGLRYVRSGREPALMLFSRKCLPAAARGVNQKGLNGRHQARFFTRDAVRTLRQQAQRERGSPQLDFDRELLPLLMQEMGCAWRSALGRPVPEGTAYELGAEERAALEAMLFPLQGRSFANADDFSTFFTCMIADDLSEARRGNQGSPIKAAADVLRDARTVLQDMIEHGGLTASSHRKFLSVYNPAINRVTFGPPSHRNEQLLALIEAGVLSVAAGPNAAIRIDEDLSQFALHTRFASGAAIQHVDALIVARLDVFSPETDESALIRNLLKRGTIRPFYNGTFHPGGVDIDQANHPLDSAARPVGNLWALGYLAEGPHYYTHALPRPRMHSRHVLDAERCVRELFGLLEERASARRQVRPRVLVAAERATT